MRNTRIDHWKNWDPNYKINTIGEEDDIGVSTGDKKYICNYCLFTMIKISDDSWFCNKEYRDLAKPTGILTKNMLLMRNVNYNHI